MAEVMSAAVLQYYRGERLFKSGGKCPAKPPDTATGDEPESILWIGYRVAKAMEFMERQKIARQLSMPEPEWVE